MINTLISISIFIGGYFIGIYLSAKLSIWRANKRRSKQQKAQEAFWEECAREADYHQRMMEAAKRMARQLSDAEKNEKESAEMIAKLKIDEREYIREVTEHFGWDFGDTKRGPVAHVVDYTGKVMEIIENIEK